MDISRKLIKLTDYLYSIEEGFVRWFLITGDEKAAVIDTGIIGNGVRETAESLTDKPLVLINTHGDTDHISGNGDFDTFYISEADYSSCGLAERFSSLKPSFVSEGQTIELGNRTLEIISLEGHTGGSIGMYDRNSRSVFAGDTVQDGTIYMFGPGRNPEAFEKSLKKLISKKNDYDRIYASHGTVELGSDFSEKVLNDWTEVNKAGYQYEEQEMFGQKIRYCRGQNCGFFMPQNKDCSGHDYMI